MPARQIAEPKISDSNAQKMFDAVSDGLEHAPNLPIYSLPQDNAKTRRREGTRPRNFRALAIKNNSALQLWSKRRIPRSIERNLIFLVDLETGVGEPLPAAINSSQCRREPRPAAARKRLRRTEGRS